ncbi:MAG: hypothetical protein E7612_07460 [Ruminococcaceae bacterium]|nr:hypothetical protein [Oscillospiraceae bacterium]
MKKKISKNKAQKREQLLKLSKNRRLIIALSSIPPFALTVTFIVFYALRNYYLWLTALTALSWLLLGGLFIYSHKNGWGCVNSKGVKTKESYTAVTVYNTVLVFLLAAFFIFVIVYKAL